MENERFDAAIRRMGTGVTRRGALGLLAGLVGLGLGEVAAKGRRHGKARKRRAGTTRVQAADASPDHKVTVCHHEGNGSWHPIMISENAAEQHMANHGDFKFDASAGGCCTDTDCASVAEVCEIAADNGGSWSGTCACTCPGGQVCDTSVCGCRWPTTSYCDRVGGGGCTFHFTTEGCRVCGDLPGCQQGDRFMGCASSADCNADEACIPHPDAPNGCGVPGINGVCVRRCAGF